MPEGRHLVVLVCVGIYLVVCVGIGIWALRRTRSTSDFFMAGRDLGIFVTAFAIFSSILSGFGFVGGPGLVYLMGTSSLWMVVAAGIGGVISFALIHKRIRLFAEARDCMSLPDVVHARYGNNATRGWTAVVILLGVVGYLATQVLAMAIVLQGILTEAGVWSDVSLEWCVVISCSVLVFYTVTGGILASVYTDLVQGAVMMVASLLVFWTVLNTFDGGMAEISSIIQAGDPEAIGPWGTFGMLACLSWFLLFALGGVGQPHVVTKSMMVRRFADIRHIVPLSFVAYSIAALLWIGIGLAMRALVVSGRHPALETPDAAAPQFLQFYTHPLLAGIVFAGLLAAIMSTADGFLNIGTAAVVHDLPRAFGQPPLQRELLWARVTTVVLAVAAAVFALYSGDLIAILGAFGWGTFAAALVPVVGIGLNWKRATPLAANVAVVVSLVINLGAKLADWTAPHHIDIGALSLAVSLVLFVGISLASTPPDLDEDVEMVMDL